MEEYIYDLLLLKILSLPSKLRTRTAISLITTNNHFRMLSTHILALAALLGIATSAPTLETRGRKLQFLGINEAGPEFGTALPGLYNKDYIWPDLTTIQGKIDSGFNVFRINIQMERLTPGGLTAGFEKYYLANLTQTVNAITSKGAYAMIQPHNYGRFNGQIMTSTSDFGTWWKNVAAVYKNNDKVIYDTNNEYEMNSDSLIMDLLTQSTDSGACLDAWWQT